MADIFHNTDNEESDEERDSDNEKSDEKRDSKNEESGEKTGSNNEPSDKATNDNVSKGNGPDETAAFAKRKRTSKYDKTSDGMLQKKYKASKKPNGKHNSSKIIMTHIIEKEQEEQEDDKDFGTCFSFRVKDEFNMNWLKLEVANWMNKHSHVVIDANGQDRTDCFLHLTEFCSCGSSKTVLHNQGMVGK